MVMNHQAGVLQALHLGRVLDNSDPETRGRLQVEILNTGMQLWAACMTSSAGHGFLVERSDDPTIDGVGDARLGNIDPVAQAVERGSHMVRA